MTIILTSESSVTLSAVARRMGPEFFQKRFACISTAGKVYAECPWIGMEQKRLEDLGATVHDVELSILPKSEALKLLENSDGIFVHGGNTFFLLQEMQRIGFKEFIHNYVASGRSYVGSSAGTIVAGPRIDIIEATDEPLKASNVEATAALGLVSIVPFVHFNDPSYASAFRIAFERALELGINVLPIRNDQFIIVVDDALQIVTASV